MAEKIELEVTFDDSEAKAGLAAIGKDLDAAGKPKKGREKADEKKKKDADSAALKSLARTAGVAVLADAFKGVPTLVANIFDPLKTAFQKQLAAAQQGLPLVGAAAGAAGGALFLASGGGAKVGELGGQTAAALVTAATTEEQFIDQFVSSGVQEEAQTRVRLGVKVDQSELNSLAQALRELAREIFNARKQAITAVNKGSPDLLGVLAQQGGLSNISAAIGQIDKVNREIGGGIARGGVRD